MGSSTDGFNRYEQARMGRELLRAAPVFPNNQPPEAPSLTTEGSSIQADKMAPAHGVETPRLVTGKFANPDLIHCTVGIKVYREGQQHPIWIEQNYEVNASTQLYRDPAGMVRLQGEILMRKVWAEFLVEADRHGL